MPIAEKMPPSKMLGVDVVKAMAEAMDGGVVVMATEAVCVAAAYTARV